MSQSPPLVSIASEGLSAQIDPFGAQLSALRDDQGRDLLWDGDPAIWAGRAPILFPIVGELNQGGYRVDGLTYRLPRHGLARRRLFTLAEHTVSLARFRLTWDDETLAIYPFQFELDLTFALAGACLTMTASIANRGEASMPASFGYHPAFRWPLPYGAERAEHRIRFATEEAAPVRRIDDAGLVKAQTFPSPVSGRDLPLADALFVDDALIFDPLASGALSYGPADGPHLQIGFEGAPYLGLWSKPGAPFVCVEPWWGIADPEGFAGDFRQKPGVFEVAPGDQRDLTMTVTLQT